MRANSIIMLILAVVFGTISVFLTQSWLQSQASLASKGPAEKAINVQTIVVASRPLRFGMALKPDNLKEVPWPGASIPDGGFAKIEDVMSKDGDRFVLNSMEPNEPVYKWKITGAGARATLSAVVEEGMRAVAVPINDVLGVAGFVLPGDRVDMMLTRKANAGTVTDILLQNVKVLAINQLADDRTNKPTSAKTVTVEVDTIDAQKLALARSVGSLSLALRSAGSTDAAAPRRVTLNDLDPAREIYAEDQGGATSTAEAAGSVPGASAASDAATKFQSVEEMLRTMQAQVAKTNKRRIVQLGDPNRPTGPLFDPNSKVFIIRGLKPQQYEVPKTEALKKQGASGAR